MLSDFLKKGKEIILGTEYLLLETKDLFYRYFGLHRNYKTNSLPPPPPSLSPSRNAAA